MEVLKQFLTGKTSKSLKYSTLIIIQFLMTMTAAEYYLQDPKITKVYSTIIPVIITIYLAALVLSYLHFYYATSKTDSPKTRFIYTIIVLVFIFVWIGYAYFFTIDITEGVVTLLSISITTILAISWWVIRNEQSKLAAKKNHTLNILLQARLSATYQKNIEDAALKYPGNVQLPDFINIKNTEERKAFMNLISYNGMMVEACDAVTLPDGTLTEIDENTAKEARAIRGLNYLLNYFEFLAVGIEKDDIHEPLIKECLIGIAYSLRHRSIHLINFRREQDEDTWFYFIEMCERWCGPIPSTQSVNKC